MQYGELLREAGFNPNPLITDNNRRAAVQATEKYVAECGPAFLFDLYDEAKKCFNISFNDGTLLFSNEMFDAHETLRTTSLVHVLRRIYPDMTRVVMRGYGIIDHPISNAYGMQIVYAGNEEEFEKWVRGKSSREEVIEIKFSKTR